MPATMRRRLVILGCALVVVVAVVGFWPRVPKEPVYQGQPLSQYLEKKAGGQRWTYDVATEQAIQAVSKEALPWLMYELGRPEPKWRERLRSWTDRFSRNRSPRAPDRGLRALNAMMGLRMLGSRAAPALPQLAKYLDVPELNWSAAWAMAAAGDAAIPYLLKRVHSTNDMIAAGSVRGLGMLANASPAATPHLVALLQSPNPRTRRLAAAELMGVNSHPELTVPALTACLHDQDNSVNGINDVATEALARLRLNSAPLVAELHRLMAGPNAALALTASNALHLLHATNSQQGSTTHSQ